MHILNTVLTTREDAGLQRAVAEDLSVQDNKDLTESYLQQLSVDYPGASRPKKTSKLVENPADEGSNTLTPDGRV